MKYSDFRTNLDVHPMTGDLLLFTDEQAITSQIKNLVFIDYYEIFWKPRIGAGVPQTLFDNFVDGDTQYKLETRIRETINRYVERAQLIDVKVIYDGHNGYTATIIYRPINKLEDVKLNVILSRTR